MAPKLYMFDTSPPVRSVLLTAKALGVTLEFIKINILKGEQLTPDFLKMNPQHTVPTLDDDGVIIWDSHAINVYLVTKYGKDDSLYPYDPYNRAVINQRLHFDSGILFPRMIRIVMPLVRKETNVVPPEKAAEIIEAYEFLEKFLEGNKWMAGDDVTLADLSLIATVTSLDLLVPIDGKKFPNVIAWIRKSESLPYYDVNKDGLELFRNLIQGLLKS
ncbi:hypothetical protein ILUMI_04824 [Ignelater luminosus]|uniref:Uncharacterized protein n=1 Tax=Ignelater luminosus TaxID=2038154 RepID=A0A8K0GJ83_IGNLU|nr:hypothetical protein ILUMI_04824 [Ignelater luminosus]